MPEAGLVLDSASHGFALEASNPWLDVFLRMAIAGLLGTVVSLLYQYSRPASDRNPGLPSTLVLLAMLIAMVTLAVDENIAVAFTLVGTLAIVRFRTPVRDTRDTSYVIFSVAVGISVGQLNLIVATAGTLALAIAIYLIREGSQVQRPTAPNSMLRLEVSPPDDDAEIYQKLISELGGSCKVERSSIDRERGSLQLSIMINGVPDEKGTHLVTSLLENPAVIKAQLTMKDPA